MLPNCGVYNTKLITIRLLVMTNKPSGIVGVGTDIGYAMTSDGAHHGRAGEVGQKRLQNEPDPLRRDLALGIGAVGLIAAFLPFVAIRPSAAAERVTWQDAMRAVIGDTVPEAGKISLLMPDEDIGGYMVPFTVAVDSPMSAADYVKSVHVFAANNPRPDVASFFFSPLSGRGRGFLSHAPLGFAGRPGDRGDERRQRIPGKTHGPSPTGRGRRSNWCERAIAPGGEL